MGFIVIDCPHCFKKDVYFNQKGYCEYHGLDKKRDLQFTVFFTCGNCDKGVLVTVLCKSGSAAPGSFHDNYMKSSSHIVEDTYPQKKVFAAPDHVPEDITYFYQQAVDNLKPGSWDSAALMGGKVLETTFKTKFPEVTGKFYNRIETLANDHILIESMKEWAHEIRLVRNEAAHSTERIEEQDARDLMSFVEVLLMYIFTLPGMLANRRSREEDTG